MKEENINNEELEELVGEKFAVIKTKEHDEKYIEITILEQSQIHFRRCYFCVDGDTVTRINNPYERDYNFIIDSVNNVEYRIGKGEKTLFMKGDLDRNKPSSLLIPKDDWNFVKQALEMLGAEIDVDETKKTEEIIEQKDYDMSLLVPTEEEIKEMIDLVDIDTFNKVIKNRLIKEISSSDKEKLGKINRRWAKEYLREWAISKYKFFRIFGNKLSVSQEVEVEPNKHSIGIMVGELKEKFPLYSSIFSYISKDAFVTKKVSKGNFAEHFFNDKRVKSGMSITKFFSLYGNKELDIEISKIYQDMGKNTIYLSIDPIDYLTVSINASGWESCHHFLKGCYRNAGLSYMVDKTSFMAFASRNNIKYPFNFPYEWNTKNWRQMIYMSEKDSTTVFSRQYPYDSDELSKKVRTLFEKLISEYFNTTNKWKLYSNHSNAKVTVDKGRGCLVYNDVGSGYNHKVIRAKDDKEFDKSITIYIGGKVKVLFGTEIINNAEADLLYGEECDSDD